MSESSSVSPSVLPLLEWLEIPAGTVTLAEDAGTFEIAPFKIARYPITNAQFDAFIQDHGYQNLLWWQGLEQQGGSPRPSDWREPDSPKLQVCWYEAVAFSRWLAAETGLSVRLPTEWEWQWAAVGESGWAYPYGATFDGAKCNTKEGGSSRPNIVTEYAGIATHFGTVDMSGSVWEWCLNEGLNPENIQPEGSANRALRGGSWNNDAGKARVDFRSHRAVRTRTFNIGFRVIAAGV